MKQRYCTCAKPEWDKSKSICINCDGVPNIKKKCHNLPPTEMYDVLHKFECLGGQLPKAVERWWEKETELNESEKNLPKPADPMGYTNEEIKKICKDRDITAKAFNAAFGVNTVAVAKDGTHRYYRCDVERALFNLNKGGKYHEWD